MKIICHYKNINLYLAQLLKNERNNNLYPFPYYSVKLMRGLFIILLASIFISATQDANKTIDTNAKIKTMFIYNFTKYIEWPQSYKQGNFVIGLLGESSLGNDLKKMAATKKAITQTFKIQKFNTVNDITKCHILIIPNEKSTQLKNAMGKVKNYSTLIITEGRGLAKQGAGINFVIQNNKQRFELNKAIIEKNKLKVSHNLLSLAIAVS